MARLGSPIVLALSLAACSGNGDAPVQGYVEGTYVYVSPDHAGRIVARPASAGATVAAGDVLVRLDDSDEVEAVAGAEARLAQAQAQLANLRSGMRPVEISVIEEEQSRWLAFNQKEIDSLNIPPSFQSEVFDADKKLKLTWSDKGVTVFRAIDPTRRGATTRSAVSTPMAPKTAVEAPTEV